ncbi:MAG TPA: glycosyltransferase family 1 protein [Bacteroidales bacterium]|nr:glycosyltransferase family 1 protein [Bacteroidales bacterium]
MKKIFIVVNVDWFFLSHRKEIALAAKKTGYDVTIVTNNTGMKPAIEGLGLKVIDLPMSRSGKNIFEELSTLNFLYKLYKREQPDVIHHVGLKTILWGTFAAKLAKIKGIANAVSGLGIIFSEENSSILSKIFIQILRYSHHRNNLAVIFQNDEDKTLFLSNHIIREDQAFMIKGSGVDLNQFCYTPEPVDGKIKVLLTARMIAEKGIFFLAEAANLLKSEYRDKVQFLLCGGIDDNPNAIREADLKAVCDGEYVSWLGYRTDVLNLLKSSHIVAFPSYYKEGLPKSLIEGTAIGRPIITTNSIGCKETVIEGYNGFLIPIKNSKVLAERLKQLFDDTQLRISMGKNSRLLAEKDFSIENVITKHLEIYKQLTTN